MILTKSDWIHISNVHFIGYIYDDEGNMADQSEIAQRFGPDKSICDIEANLKNTNGCFALVIEGADFLLAAVDRVRSIPLFWDQNGILADSSEALHHLDIDTLKSGEPLILAEFFCTGYVCGDQTLDPGVRQIPAANYLVIKRGTKPSLKRYYSYCDNPSDEQDPPTLCKKLHRVHKQVINRLIQSLEGRPALIPLSGGYDSRLIAYLLKRANYPHIIAFTYDSPKGPEALISKKVAHHLQIPWLCLEHNRESWYKAYISEERKAHYKYAVNAVSSAHIQDWHAVRDMKEKKLIPADSVFIPGHSADLLQGSHLPGLYLKQERFSDLELIEQIRRQHYSLWQSNFGEWQELFAQRIRETIDIPENMSAHEASGLALRWNIRERQAKFIVNSVRVYEDFGYQWRLPWWDSEIMDFWAKVPLQLRVNRLLWHIYRKKYLPVPYPAFRDYSIPIRARNKLLRIMFGEIMDLRYGRFAQYRNPFQYASEKVGTFMREDLVYPDFVDPHRPILRCNMNALQALRAIYEL